LVGTFAKGDCISVLYTVCDFQGKTQPIAVNAEIEKSPVKTSGIKHRQTEQIPDLELQNRCSTTELSWPLQENIMQQKKAARQVISI
jgi:hypothetical protein